MYIVLDVINYINCKDRVTLSLSGRKTHLDRYRYTRKEPLILVESFCQVAQVVSRFIISLCYDPVRNVSNYKFAQVACTSFLYQYLKIHSKLNIKSNSRSINSAIEQFKNSQTKIQGYFYVQNLYFSNE